MPAQWTADILGEMHLKGVTAKRLAAAIGWHPKYLSQVLNGHVNPKDAERKIRSALDGFSAKHSVVDHEDALTTAL